MKLFAAVGTMAVACCLTSVTAQTPASPTFEVTSVKPDKSGPGTPGAGTIKFRGAD